MSTVNPTITIIQNLGTPDVFLLEEVDPATRCKLLDVIDTYNLDQPTGAHRPGVIALLEISPIDPRDWYLVPGEWWDLADPSVLSQRQRNGKYLASLAITKSSRESISALLRHVDV